MRHQLARNLSLGAALATAGIVGSNAIVGGTNPAAASATSSSVGTPGSGSTDSSSVSAPASTPLSTVPLTPTPVAGSATQFSVVAGESATIIVDTTNGALRIVAFAPHPGWFTVRLEQASATEMSAQLQTDSTQVTLTARVADGALVAELSSGGVPSAVPGSTPGTGPDGSAPGTGPDGSSTSTPDDGSISSTSSPDNSSSTSTPDDSSSTSSPDDDDNSGPGGGDDSGGDDSGGNSGPG